MPQNEVRFFALRIAHRLHRVLTHTMTALGLTSIRTTGDKIEIVDQLLLPHTVAFIEIDSVEQAHEAIKSMKVRVSAVHAVDPH